MNENWAYWILLIYFIIVVISVFIRASGYKTTISWDADLTTRLIGMSTNIALAVVCAIALGWLG